MERARALSLPVYTMHTHRGRLELDAGRPEQALTCFEEALNEVGERYGANEIRAEWARAQAQLGDVNTARDTVRGAVAALREEESPLKHFRGLCALAEVEHLGHDPEASRRAVDEAEQLLHDHDVPEASPLFTRVRALRQTRHTP